MRTILFAFLASVVAVGCGNDKATPPNNPGVDAPPDPDDAPGGDLTLDCASYCGAILGACTGVLQQYESMQSCLGTCEQFQQGALTDTTGNTLGCRIYHTEFAQLDAETHCEHAGPSGGSMCGATLCESFCAIAPTICPDQWSANRCVNECSALASMGPFNIASAGNTQECRLYHLTLATIDAATHCPHTDPQASATCN